MVNFENLNLPTASEKMLDQPVNISLISSESVDLKMSEPMMLSFGTFNTRPSGWLNLIMKGGLTVIGQGEGATLPRPLFTDDSGLTIASAMRELVSSIGSSATTSREAIEKIHSYDFDGPHYPTARFAAEMAVIDGITKLNDTSVADFIDIPKEIEDVPYGKSIGGSDIESLLFQIETALRQNARKIKLKISPNSYDVVTETIIRIRKEHPKVELMVDANGGFDPLNPIELAMIRSLDEMGLIMIEEPVSRAGTIKGLDAVRLLRSLLPNMTTPICLDDCLGTLQDCRNAIDEGLADIINIKPGRIGSFLQSLELACIAKSQGRQVMVGGMFEATPGRYVTTTLGAYCLSKGFSIAGDLSLAQERLSEDLVAMDKQLKLNDLGNITLPRSKGWGF